VCGICGFVGVPDPAMNVQAVRAMTKTLIHRGPDGEGEYQLRSRDGRKPLEGWLGHRRLRILDLTAAAEQPMVTDDGSVAITFNGEVYNYQELRKALAATGHRFRSTGDTEVVLRAYLEWGEGFVHRIDGMFALALWDSTRGRIVMARDRAGKKPLFYSQLGGRLSFASEIKALLALPWLRGEPDLARLPEYLFHGYVPNPGTFYRGISQVPPASVISYDAEGLQGPSRYWDACSDDEPRAHGERIEPTIGRLVREAVERRMVADVPLGALLSGGMDSSIVVGLMSQTSAEPVRTFSVGFPEEPSFDERAYARTVAAHFRTQHREFTVRADAAALMDELLWHHDQPYADSSAIPTYLVSQLAREHVTVVLTGDGGDEVFGGYERFAAAALARPLPPALAAAARLAVRQLPRSDGYHGLRRALERYLRGAELPTLERYSGWISLFDQDVLAELLPDKEKLDAGPASLRAAYGRARHLKPLDQILYANFCTYLPDDLAVKMDRMSMAHSLEARSPFLDTALIEFMSGVPARQKVGVRRPKPLLRRSFAPLLPPAIWRRRKHGFGVPVGRWFRQELKELLEDEVLASGARTRLLLDSHAVGQLWYEHLQGHQDHGPRFWALLTLERWLRAMERGASGQRPSRNAVMG
jgi:asparagine synthase (glutamine-hydrolysing)